MFNKHDPLINSVKKVMEENELRRKAEADLNEELGIASKRALPHEHHKNYDALLEQKIAEALHPNQQKLDVHEPEKDKLTAQDFKMLRAKKKPMKEAIGDKEGTAGTLRKNGKPVVPDTLANNPFMQASPDKAPMPPERPKDLGNSAPMPPERPKDLKEAETKNPVDTFARFPAGTKNPFTAKKPDTSNSASNDYDSVSNDYDSVSNDKGDSSRESRNKLNEISRNLARRVIRKASAEKEMGSKKDRSKAVELAGKKAYSIPSEPKVRATNEEVVNEGKVLYTHPKADIKVVRKGEGSKEGAAIEVHKGGKKVASGDYDSGADAFFMNVGGKGQKSFDSAKDIANHFHGLSEQFQQIDEVAPKGAKYERMVKHIKAGYEKDGKLTDKEKSIAYATAWKAKNKKMEEGLTAEQVMAEIRKNLGEAKMKKIEEERPDPEENPTPPGHTPPQPPATTAQSGQVSKGPDTAPSRLPTFSTGAPGTTSVTPTKPAEPPKVSSNDDIKKALGDTSGAPSGGTRMGNAPSPAVTQKATPAPTPAPAPKPAPSAPTPSAPKPAAPAAPSAPAGRQPNWMERTFGGGKTSAPVDYNDQSPLGALRQYDAAKAAGAFDKPEASAPKPAAPRPAAPRPAGKPYSPPISMGRGRMAIGEETEATEPKLSFNDTINKILKG